jgi:hypothetical protein
MRGDHREIIFVQGDKFELGRHRDAPLAGWQSHILYGNALATQWRSQAKPAGLQRHHTPTIATAKNRVRRRRPRRQQGDFQETLDRQHLTQEA